MDDNSREYYLLRNEEHLAAYHFVTSVGVLIRVLDQACKVFPSIKSTYEQAAHLRTEGRETRNMIEHAYGERGYLTGGGHHRDRFWRHDGHIRSDATSIVIKDDDHWLGNRLCVELVTKEVTDIYIVAKVIEPPVN